jgi:hypothetical protein
MSDNCAQRKTDAGRLRGAIVVVEKPTKALRPSNGSTCSRDLNNADQIVPQTLMVALVVVVDDIVQKRATKMPLTERNGPVSALFFIERPNRSAWALSTVD